MKQLLTTICLLALSLAAWAQQQQDTMFIHTKQTVYEFPTIAVDSITPKLGDTEALDSLHIYRNNTITNRFRIGDIDSIIFYRVEIDVEIDSCDVFGHDMGDPVVIDPTCLADGSSTISCSRCDYEEVTTIPALGHDMSDPVIVDATCETAGSSTISCSRCDYEEVTVIPALGHDMGDPVIVDPTCETDGSSTISCSRCDYEEVTVIDALGHDWGNWVITPATCIAEGDSTRTCQRSCCTNVTDTRTIAINPNAHDWEVYGTGQAPTCTEDGFGELQCKLCGEISTGAIIPALGHDDGEWHTAIEPTCITEGERELRCTRCNHVLDTEVIDALGHDMGDPVVVDATCETDGSSTISCSRCDYEEVTVIDALGHDWGEWVITPATCIAAGDSTRTCQRSCCIDVTETRPIEALGHDDGEWHTSIEPTCTTEGERELRCTRCNHVLDTEVIDALGHDMGDPVVVDPTCETDGSSTISCSRCDYEEVTVIDALGHDMGDPVVVDPTCETDGSSTISCSRCDHEEVTVIDALGHDMGDPVIVDATCLTDGSSTISCSRCDHEEVTVIDALGHDWDEWVITPATCLAEGDSTRICKRDANHTESRPIEALGHDMGDPVVIDATCTEDGSSTISCSRCDYEEVTVIDALGHDDGEWHTIFEPTCTMAGSRELRCTRCEHVLDTEVITPPVPILADITGEMPVCGSTTLQTAINNGVEGTIYWRVGADPDDDHLTNPGETSPVITTGGTWHARARSTKGECWSEPKTRVVTFYTVPTIGTVTPTADRTTVQGTPFESSLTITDAPTGIPTPTIQWYSNTTPTNSGGTSLGTANGAQTNTFTPPVGTVNTAGVYYYAVVTNICGPVATLNTSGKHTVTVPIPICNHIPVDVSLCNGTNHTAPGTVYWGGVNDITVHTRTISGNGITQVWSDIVSTSNCDKTAFTSAYTETDCRNAENGFNGHYFNLCFVAHYQNQLCPAPWRVPTCQDFINLDIALGGTGENRWTGGTDRSDPTTVPGGETIEEQIAWYIGETGSGTTATNNGGIWGGTRFTGYAYASSTSSSSSSYYWSSAHGAYSLRLEESSLSPAHGIVWNYGLALRCVRDLDPCEMPEIPATPETIQFDPNPVCPGGTFTASVPAVSGAISYTWTIPATATDMISDNSTSNTLTITDAGSVEGEHLFSVVAHNACATSSASTASITVGHDSKWDTTAVATCTTAGSRELRCTRCNLLLDTEVIAALPVPSLSDITGETATCSTTTLQTAINNGVEGTIYWLAGADPDNDHLTNAGTTSPIITESATWHARARSTADGCWSEPKTQAVTVHDIPAVVIGHANNPHVACDVSSLPLAATAVCQDVTTIHWRKDEPADESNRLDPASNLVNATADGTFYARARSVYGCWSDPDSLEFRFRTSPAVGIVSPVTEYVYMPFTGTVTPTLQAQNITGNPYPDIEWWRSPRATNYTTVGTRIAGTFNEMSYTPNMQEIPESEWIYYYVVATNICGSKASPVSGRYMRRPTGLPVDPATNCNSTALPFLLEKPYFKTNRTWRITGSTANNSHVWQEWSDVVLAPGCATRTVAQFTGNYASNCVVTTYGTPRPTSMQTSNYGNYAGDLFSWCMVQRFGHLLCPPGEGWRVPTQEDYCDLHRGMLNVSGCPSYSTPGVYDRVPDPYYTNSRTTSVSTVNNGWGAERNRYVWDGSYHNRDNSANTDAMGYGYWTQTMSSATNGRVLYIVEIIGSGEFGDRDIFRVNQSYAGKGVGLNVRCVRDVVNADCNILQPPGRPGEMTFSANSVCVGDGFTVTVPAVRGATSYTWTLPATATGMTAHTTTTTGTTLLITLAGRVGGIHEFSVVANNACGTSAARVGSMRVEDRYNTLTTTSKLEQTVVQNTFIEPISLTADGGTGIEVEWTEGIPVGLTVNGAPVSSLVIPVSGNEATLDGAPSNTGFYAYTVTSKGGVCSSPVSHSGSIRVVPACAQNSNTTGNNGCDPNRHSAHFTDIGTPYFKTPNTWVISDKGIYQEWSDVVLTTTCGKEPYQGYAGEPTHYANDCRMNRTTGSNEDRPTVTNEGGNTANYRGDLFSWCAVMNHADLLCPAPWRVPTCQDFINLDIALGGSSYNRENDDAGVNAKYRALSGDVGQFWRGPLTGYSGDDGTLFSDGTQAYYWSSSEISVPNARYLYFNTSSSVYPQGTARGKGIGQALRCVRDVPVVPTCNSYAGSTGVASCTGSAGVDPGTVSWQGSTNINTHARTISGNGITQIWSGVVATTGCDKEEWNSSDVNADCRNAINGFDGHYFSWCYVMRHATALCPAPWRVPTCQDFVNLDLALGGNGRNRTGGTVNGHTLETQLAWYVGSTGNGTNAHNNVNSIWGGTRFTAYSNTLTGSPYSRYWSSDLSSATEAYRLFLHTGEIGPQNPTSRSSGFGLRCVRD